MVRCVRASGDGKGDIAKDMKLNMADFTNASTLKDCTDGEIYYVIKNGHNEAARRRPPHRDGRGLGSGELRPLTPESRRSKGTVRKKQKC